ncbi:hypothetical protein BDFG_05376 [Blastomyces dermatitidis ATCC 26199]|nr:hypothetical protein BDFG_05376 [Blastomyces dermatitidis ATCC 26199]
MQILFFCYQNSAFMSHESSQTYVSYDSTDNNEKTSEDVKKAAVIQVVLSHSMKLNTEQLSMTEVSGDHIERVSNGEEDCGELLMMSESITLPVRVPSDLHSISVRQNARSAAKRRPRLLARQGYYVRA